MGGGGGRPTIRVSEKGEITHNFCKCRIVMREDMISVGCTDVTPEALQVLIDKYNQNFPKREREVIVQC